MPQSLPDGFQIDQALSKQMGTTVAVNPQTGKRIRWSDGAGPKLTEDQGKSQDYGRQMAKAERQYLDARKAGYDPRSMRNGIANALEDFKLPWVGSPMAALAPVVRDDASDRGVAAQKAWLDSRLKAMTGAGQNALEAAESPRTYFPQPGEGESTMEPKYDLRREAYKSTRIRSGPASAKLPNDYPNPADDNTGRGGGPVIRVYNPKTGMIE